MPQTTPTLGMTTYDLVNDGGVYFSTFRTTLAGYTNSALTKIDAFATQATADINLLKSNPPIVRVPAIKTDDFSYAVTGITEITEYRNGMYINLSLDNTNLGTISLNINNLGSKGVYKIGTDGLVANMSAGDLKLNKMYLFRYNGTAWVWVNAVTSDQLNVVGTVGNLTKISTNNTLEDSGVTFSNTTTNNALAQRTASGQIKGVTPVDSDDLVNKTYADTKAPISSPTLTGIPLAPTATAGTNTTQIATTAFVSSEIDNDRPYGTITSTLTNGGTGTVGTSTKVAREDHTHTMPTSVLQSQVINDLTTGGETNVLSAQQGIELNSAIGQKANSNNVVLTGTAVLNNKNIATTEVTNVNAFLLNGWTISSTITLAKVGNMVFLFGGLAISGVKTSGTVFVNIPVGFRPSNAQISSIDTFDNLSEYPESVSIEIRPNGDIAFNTNSKSYIRGKAMWYV